jgi:hypothetical protein
VHISATQTFQGDHFDLGSIVVSNIAGISGANKGCAGEDATIHIKDSIGFKSCTIIVPDLERPDITITFTPDACSWVPSKINMKDLDSNIGLEFTAHGGA